MLTTFRRHKLPSSSESVIRMSFRYCYTHCACPSGFKFHHHLLSVTKRQNYSVYSRTKKEKLVSLPRKSRKKNDWSFAHRSACPLTAPLFIFAPKFPVEILLIWIHWQQSGARINIRHSVWSDLTYALILKGTDVRSRVLFRAREQWKRKQKWQKERISHWSLANRVLRFRCFTLATSLVAIQLFQPTCQNPLVLSWEFCFINVFCYAIDRVSVRLTEGTCYS